MCAGILSARVARITMPFGRDGCVLMPARSSRSHARAATVAVRAAALDRLDELRDDLALGLFPGSLEGAPGGVAVAAAAEALGDARDVHVALRAKADAVESGRGLFEEGARLHVAAAHRVVDEEACAFFK